MFCVRRGCGAGAQSTSSAFYIQSSSAFCSNDLETMPKILKPKKENNDLATMPTIRKKKKKKNMETMFNKVVYTHSTCL